MTTSNITVRDVQSQQLITVPAHEDRYTVIVKGVRCKLYPQAIQTMVKPGQKFDAITNTGRREMVKVR
jgi:hypothetical protein